MFLGYKTICCNIKCYWAFGIVKGLDKGQITPEQAKQELDTIGITKHDIEGYVPSIKDFLLSRINFNEQSVVPNFEYNQPEEQMVDRYSKKHSRRENKHGV